MSWLFSQALVEDFSAASSWDGVPSAQLNVMPTRHRFWRQGKTIDPSNLSRFGLTCAVLTESHGAALLTWFREDSLVRTYQQQGMASELMENDQGSGVKWQESSVKYNPALSSWRTHHCLWEEDLPWCSVTLPKWGLMRNGVVFLHPTSTRPISVIASGLWPTPTVSANNNRPYPGKQSGFGLSTAAKLWTTPSASDARRGGMITPKMTGTSLVQQINTPLRWPTPTASLATKGDRVTPRKSREGGTLIEAVSARTWPTPVASMSKGSSPAALTRKNGASRANDRLDHAVMASEGGQLNPLWVEWLMGWPSGWTDLKPLEMARFQEWRQQHSVFSKDNREAT